MATIDDLEYGVLSYIIILLVQSSDGAADLARAISVCKEFNKFGEDENILKTVVFDKVRLNNLLLHVNGLVNKCAHARNPSAQFLLAKTIMLSAYQLLGMKTDDIDGSVGIFMAYFQPEQASTSNPSKKRLVHYELVKHFVRQCTSCDLDEFGAFLSCYVSYSVTAPDEQKSLLMDLIHDNINWMRAFAGQIRSLRRLGEIKEYRDHKMRVLTQAAGKVNESCDDDDDRSQRERELVEASSECGASVMALIVECAKANENYEGLFGYGDNAGAFQKRMEELRGQFEEYRGRVLSAFDQYFP